MALNRIRLYYVRHQDLIISPRKKKSLQKNCEKNNINKLTKNNDAEKDHF